MLGQLRERAVAAGVGVKLRDLYVGVGLVQTADLFRAVAVFPVGLSGVLIHARGQQPYAQLLRRDAHEKLRRCGDDDVVRALLCKVPRVYAVEIFRPERLQLRVHIGHAAQKAIHPLLEGGLAHLAEQVDRQQDERAQQRPDYAGVPPQAPAHERHRAVHGEDGLVPVVYVDFFHRAPLSTGCRPAACTRRQRPPG